ncbi:MAG: copper amine oxidase N-terminal domain-containing protein, partial [Caldisericia bacterium]|nr:copper amine oxidase N-terminal domain-containing protein [Caldisericia bacterium]
LTNEVILHVFLDTVPPKLAIQESNWETKEDHFTIIGKTEPTAQLLLDEEFTEKSPDGSFAIEIPLVVGMNEGLIQAIDQAGNKTDFVYHIKRFGIIQLTIGSLIMEANGTEYLLDHPPYIKSGRTMVPLRALSEVLNYEVIWIVERQEIQIVGEEIMITLWINRNLITLTILLTHQVTNKTIDAAPEIKTSRTFIPLRLVSEEFGAKVAWDSKTSSIEILY